ncbi:hypothetical protein Skr01_63730 [Sphaerisporangium krabiense]|uniref:Uncharacterized protein n=1 Tax=Sphaerisporangium krabiense TaxID=763782 RepID=A0A7W8Z6A4_9ACTN|nr:hypothetical protein [Sphaerisporangium krabiense]MBB5628291.1 hypothetical protein [Sphaerisporangium krabiense]GII66288.1 hypothetical protein Skr01_63730 [Sphaerisporangium krabiense]
MILDAEGSTAELIEAGTRGSRLYVVHNGALERLLFDRNLIGADFRRACLESSRLFLGHLGDEYQPGRTAELAILSKGLVYQLGEAAVRQSGENLPLNLVATSRVAVSPDTARVEVSYAQFEAPADTLLVGDTVASGATIIAALGRYLESHRLERVYVLSYAGALRGARRITAFCARRGIRATFLYGLAAFGLGLNGFDLSFLHPDTLTRRAYADRAARQFSGKAVSAVGWDFGAQATAPRKYRHLCWVEAEVWGLHGSDCLAVAERPEDWAELSRERAAYADALGPDWKRRLHGSG